MLTVHTARYARYKCGYLSLKRSQISSVDDIRLQLMKDAPKAQVDPQIIAIVLMKFDNRHVPYKSPTKLRGVRQAYDCVSIAAPWQAIDEINKAIFQSADIKAVNNMND